MRKILLALIAVCCLFIAPKSSAWSNGGYSADPEHPDYGTHDWIAQHALDWLPGSEKGWIDVPAYLLGTELPDNPNSSIGGIGDTTYHHVYLMKNYTLQDDAAAVRAQEEYDLALSYLQSGDFRNASIRAGVMTHYIADVAVWCHVMGTYTDWGAESNHSNYENYVTGKTKNYSSPTFTPYLSFDGALNDDYPAYESTLQVGLKTTFGWSSIMNCTWMNENYGWGNDTFFFSCVGSLNLAVNTVTDVLHRLATEGGMVDEGGVFTIMFCTSLIAMAAFFYRRK